MVSGIVFRYISGGLGILCLVLFLLLQGEKLHSAKVEKRAAYYRSELQRISTAKDEQAKTTRGTIERTRIVYRDADKRAGEVESAPVTPGQCRTPDAVLQADL